VFSLGYNDDALNDQKIYNASEDLDHPLYGERASESKIMQGIMAQSPNQTAPITPIMNERSPEEEYRIEVYNLKKVEEHIELNKGKRRILLKQLNDKLRQQASSSIKPEIVSISGAIKVPGDYPLTKNASYMDLIELAGGYKDDAYIESAEIRRSLIDSSGAMVINTSDVDLTQLSEIRLGSRDHLHIKSVKDWDVKDMVVLSGEVFYPGGYLISPNETLSSVIRRAGGFTNESFIKGAIFTRESIKDKEREQLQILGDNIRRDQAARSMTKESEDFAVSSNEVEASISALLSSAVYGRLIIDIPLLMNGNAKADIVLQDGDVLSIPKFTNAVTVVGEVRRAGSFVIQDNYNVDNYLELAAGMTARGDVKEIYIIRADGSVKKNNSRSNLLSFESNKNEIQAGDTIVVPIKSSYQTPLNLYSTVSQVVFQSIASIAAFSTILK
jgi:polysaccharide biosynthesis/export protein